MSPLEDLQGRPAGAWNFPAEVISQWEIGLLICFLFCVVCHRKFCLCFGTVLKQLGLSWFPVNLWENGFPRVYLGSPGDPCTTGKRNEGER